MLKSKIHKPQLNDQKRRMPLKLLQVIYNEEIPVSWRNCPLGNVESREIVKNNYMPYRLNAPIYQSSVYFEAIILYRRYQNEHFL